MRKMNGKRFILGLMALMMCLTMCAPLMATVTYPYENDNKTYVATVTSAETAISLRSRAPISNPSRP